MIEFFFFAIIGIILLSIILGPGSTNVTGAINLKGIEPCPPHKWIYIKVVDPIDRSERERMVCDKCKKPPGVE